MNSWRLRRFEGIPARDRPQFQRDRQWVRRVLRPLAQGRMKKEIAGSLGVTDNMVYCCLRRIDKKLHLRSRMEAVAKLSPRG